MAQEHFIDLCRLVGHATPAEMDPTGRSFTFEAGAAKQGGGEGWADVYKEGYFAWEYKGKHKDLDAAYRAAAAVPRVAGKPAAADRLGHRAASSSTPTSPTRPSVVMRSRWTICSTPDMLAHLRDAFFNPEALRGAADDGAGDGRGSGASSPGWPICCASMGADPHAGGPLPDPAAVLPVREDIGLLPNNLFTQLVENTPRQRRRVQRAAAAALPGDVRRAAGLGWR